jgi:hypothetical protein
MSRRVSGVLIIDATFIRHLDDPESIARLDAVCRSCDLRVYPSVINVVEALKHKSPAFRERLVDALATWAGNRPLLPWPAEVLKLAGLAAARGKHTFDITGKDLPYLVKNPAALEEDSERSAELVASLEQKFRAVHDDIRVGVQRDLKRLGKRGAWTSCADFLNEEWRQPNSLKAYAAILWSKLELPGAAPVDQLIVNEPWRLALDGLGSAVYDRVIRHEQTRNPPSQLDLLQLVYLAFHSRSRVLVTNDASFLQAAEDIVAGSYVNCRVVTADHRLAA